MSEKTISSITPNLALPIEFDPPVELPVSGEFFIGFALLFMGLDALKDTVPDLRNNPEILEFLANYAHFGILSALLFVAIGTILTVIIQSSSATMALTITMCYNGWIPFEIAAPMVLGENIGRFDRHRVTTLLPVVRESRLPR